MKCAHDARHDFMRRSHGPPTLEIERRAFGQTRTAVQFHLADARDLSGFFQRNIGHVRDITDVAVFCQAVFDGLSRFLLAVGVMAPNTTKQTD